MFNDFNFAQILFCLRNIHKYSLIDITIQIPACLFVYPDNRHNTLSLLALAGGNRRTADVKSKGFSQLFTLDKDDFEAIMRDYPEAKKILNKRAKLGAIHLVRGAGMILYVGGPTNQHTCCGKSGGGV